jgi:hypothetical protein
VTERLELRRQAIEQERSEGSVQTMNRILGTLGLKLGAARVRGEPLSSSAGTPDREPMQRPEERR